MIFAPGIPEYIARVEALNPPDLATAPLAEKRRAYVALCQAFDGPLPPEIEITDLPLDLKGRRIGLRLYRPRGQGAVPLLVFMHGGGFVLGDLESHNGICADLAQASGVALLAVDYRLSPEHPHPTPHEDCWAALLYAVEQAPKLGIAAERILVGGDSAGGNLAAGLCLRARREGGPRIAGQVLIYPSLGLEVAAPELFKTADAPGLTRADMIAFRAAYLGGAALGRAAGSEDATAVPLLAADFAGLPPVYMIAMENDPLRDDAEVYAERLRADGVACDFTVWPGLIHGSLRARHSSPAAGAAFAHIAAGLRALTSL